MLRYAAVTAVRLIRLGKRKKKQAVPNSFEIVNGLFTCFAFFLSSSYSSQFDTHSPSDDAGSGANILHVVTLDSSDSHVA